MTRLPPVAVVSRARTFLQAQQLLGVVQTSLGMDTPVFLDSSVVMDTDRELLRAAWPQVTFVTGLIDGVGLELPPPVDYVIILPPCFPLALAGVFSGVALLEERRELRELGGLIVDPDHGISAVATVDVGGDNPLGPTLASFDLLHPQWLAWGQFAYSPVSATGGPVVVRRESFASRHLLDVPLLLPSLTSAFSGNAKPSAVFTGFGLVARGLIGSVYPETGQVFTMPDEVYSHFFQEGITQAVVVHRGALALDDETATVTFFADNQISTVDDASSDPPVGPTRYFSLEPERPQWGPGFDFWRGLLGVHCGLAGPGAIGRSPGLSPNELRVLGILRKIAGILPSWLFGFAKRILAK